MKRAPSLTNVATKLSITRTRKRESTTMKVMPKNAPTFIISEVTPAQNPTRPEISSLGSPRRSNSWRKTGALASRC